MITSWMRLPVSGRMYLARGFLLGITNTTRTGAPGIRGTSAAWLPIVLARGAANPRGMSEASAGMPYDMNRQLPAYHLVRQPARPDGAPVLDKTQQAVVDHAGQPLLVLAGPGTGKTTAIVETVVERITRR